MRKLHHDHSEHHATVTTSSNESMPMGLTAAEEAATCARRQDVSPREMTPRDGSAPLQVEHDTSRPHGTTPSSLTLTCFLHSCGEEVSLN